MSHTQISEEIARLKDVLEQERHFLLSGQPLETATLLGVKLAAMEELEKAFGSLAPEDIPSPYRREMAGIVEAAKENAIHFEAVQNGLRQAISRMESLHASAYVGSYTQTGGKVAFTEVTGQFLKKA